MNQQFEASQKAYHWHKGQSYGDRNYFSHLTEVATYVRKMLDNTSCSPVELDEAIAVAYLHDILEDTEIPYLELVGAFTLKVVDAVLAVTKVRGESYPEYIAKVKANPLARLVKIADTTCNLQNSVIEGNVKRIHKYTQQLNLLTHP